MEVKQEGAELMQNTRPPKLTAMRSRLLSSAEVLSLAYRVASLSLTLTFAYPVLRLEAEHVNMSK